MTAAFELTNSKALREQHEVTIYQLGWRLGGKGASGRNPVDGAELIQEHGLHILMGCYENSFRMLRQCYKELNRPRGTPLRTIRDALKPHSSVDAEQQFHGDWHRWNINFPEDKTWCGCVRLPGDRKELPGFLTYIKRVFQWMESGLLYADAELVKIVGLVSSNLHSQLKNIGSHLHPYLDGLHKSATQSGKDSLSHDTAKFTYIHQELVKLRKTCREHWEGSDGFDIELLRAFILLDLGMSSLIGVFKYDLFFNTFDTINDFDFRDWLLDCGAAQVTVDSPLVTVLYELVFAYENGKSVGEGVVPNLEAGTLMRALPHMMAGYTGAFMWKMQSSMGDTIFAPMYQVLKKRGVTFKFFHKVEDLHVKDGELNSIDISTQVELNGHEYDPLIDVKVDGFKHPQPAWPAEPIYSQIKEGDRLQKEGINLESFYSPWVDTGKKITLKVGEDFDHAILGIAIGAFPYLCKELIENDKDWKAMVDHVKTVQTQAAQFWLKPSFKDLGFAEDGAVVGNIAASPLDTEADMTFLLNNEGWSGNKVKALAYFTGPMEGPDQAPPASNQEYPSESMQKLEKTVTALLQEQVQILWPNFKPDSDVVARYLRVNVDPSERYVMSVAGSSKHRLKANDSKFKNLLLAGDWTECRINMGCVEAAAISGMQASQELCGHPKKILLYSNRIL